jgi:DNA polymerase III delta' subunit
MSGRRTRPGQPEPEAGAAALPARLWRPLGQGPVLAQWLQRARRLDLPHAVMVEGAAGVGKTTVLQWLAAALLCPSALDEHEPCGVCRTCTRIANGTFADLHVLERAVHEDQTKPSAQPRRSFHHITIEQVRDVQARLLRQPVEGRARVVVVATADTMREEAQNALLKTLEEPGAATFLLLEARRPEELLPTVRSRVQRLRVLPLDADTIRRELQQRIPARAAQHEDAVRLADGSLGRALFACTERAVQLHDVVRSVLATTNGLRPLALAGTVLGGERDLRAGQEATRLFLWLLRAELRARRDALAAAAPDTYPAASAEPWTTWLESTLAAERDLDLLIPPEQVLTACFVEWSA